MISESRTVVSGRIPMNIRYLDDIDLKNKNVLIRLDLNVPVKNDEITDDTRIRAALPTIRHVLERTDRVALCSHLGRPKGQVNPEMSLEPIGTKLAHLLEREVLFVADYTSEPADQVLGQMDKGQLVLFENLRFHAGETQNDPEFSRILARGFDAYINDAFGTAHRAHASTVGVPTLLDKGCCAAGLLMRKELDALTPLLRAPDHPFSVVMGGSKVSDKIAVILNLLERCNHLLIGGAMAYTFLAYRGIKVGKSRVENDRMDQVESIYRNAEARNVRIHLPIDHVAASQFDETAEPVAIDRQSIPDDLMGLDIGPQTRAQFGKFIRDSRTTMWNGPMGVFEWPSFAQGSFAIAQAMAQSPGTTVIGGGDSVAAAVKAGVTDKISHISTGGGASLEFLEGKILPGLKVLEK